MTARARAPRALEEAGDALVELALSLPLLVLILAGTADFARVFYVGIALENAARTGSQYGSYSLAQSGDTSGMQSRAEAATSLSGVTATAAQNCRCLDDSGTVLADPVSCALPASTACTAGHRVITVTVTTTGTFAAVMSRLPGIPHSLTITRSSTQRVP